MRNAGGYAVTTGPDGVVERDTITCGHCQKVVFIPPKADPADLGGLCKMCMTHICEPCVGKMKCTPFERQLETMEAKGRMLKAMGV